jgi:hypothetical protein
MAVKNVFGRQVRMSSSRGILSEDPDYIEQQATWPHSSDRTSKWTGNSADCVEVAIDTNGDVLVTDDKSVDGRRNPVRVSPPAWNRLLERVRRNQGGWLSNAIRRSEENSILSELDESVGPVATQGPKVPGILTSDFKYLVTDLYIDPPKGRLTAGQVANRIAVGVGWRSVEVLVYDNHRSGELVAVVDQADKNNPVIREGATLDQSTQQVTGELSLPSLSI